MSSTLHVVGLPHRKRKHGPDCGHCKAIRREGVPRERVNPAPLCPCHGEAMRWNKSDRLVNGGYWRCTLGIKESERRGRLRKFGLSEADYDQILQAQGGVCAICAVPPGGRWNRLAVDHDHETGDVRGLLCMTCNTMLGRLERRFDATMRYLGRES